MISLLHPSRGRLFRSVETAVCWHDKALVKSFQHILSVDNNDPTDYSLAHNELSKKLAWTHFLFADNDSVVLATNRAAMNSKGDIMVYLSDDFDCPVEWDELIRKEFEGVDGPMLLKVDDCLQKFHVPVLTIPIMNRALYERLGYFWHPEYKSMFVDEDLYWTCKNNGWIKECPHLKFPHNHHSTGVCENDETYKRSAANWDQGKEVFQRRKKEGFPL